MDIFKRWVMLTLSLLVGGCASLPDGVTPIQNFNLERYLGTWYEIARLDHSFERGLTDVTATYTRRDDGGIKVLNRGYDPDKNKWKQATGKAYFVDTPDKGFLKVSFFGPFYGAYVIFWLDKNYQYAFVSGPDRDYLWLLARSPQVPKEIIEKFHQKANALRFDLTKLVMVKHSRTP